MFDNVVKPEDVKEINVILKYKLFPNPNASNFNISITNLKDDKKVEIYVYDVTDRLILQIDYTNTATFWECLHLCGINTILYDTVYPTGIYKYWMHLYDQLREWPINRRDLYKK